MIVTSELVMMYVDKMMLLTLLLMISALVARGELKRGDVNVCEYIITHLNTQTHTKITNEKYEVCCKRFIGACTQRCQKYRSKITSYTKTITVSDNIKRYRCCKGWDITNGKCLKPLCTPPCSFTGTCIRPDTCKCQDGYFGRLCDYIVKPGGKNVCSKKWYYTKMESKPFQRVAYHVVNERYCVRRVLGICSQYGTRTSKRSKMVDYTKIVPVTKQKIGYDCCKGWQNVGGDDCPVPICNPGCLNGGACVTPGTCRCKSGFFGDRCQYNLKPGGKNVCKAQVTYTSSLVRPMTRISTESYTGKGGCAKRFIGICTQWKQVTLTRTKTKSFTKIVYRTLKKWNGKLECCSGWIRALNGECSVRTG